MGYRQIRFRTSRIFCGKSENYNPLFVAICTAENPKQIQVCLRRPADENARHTCTRMRMKRQPRLGGPALYIKGRRPRALATDASRYGVPPHFPRQRSARVFVRPCAYVPEKPAATPAAAAAAAVRWGFPRRVLPPRRSRTADDGFHAADAAPPPYRVRAPHPVMLITLWFSRPSSSSSHKDVDPVAPRALLAHFQYILLLLLLSSSQ